MSSCTAYGFLSLALALSGCATVTPLEVGQCSITDGLAAPESAVFDASSRSWYVSNGGARGPGDGFISQLDASGAIIQREFATGLDDPTGIAMRDGELYVADGTRLVLVEMATPESQKRVTIPGAMFLNDVALDPRSTDVFVSDTFADRVYVVRGESVRTLAEGGALHAPNGLYYRDHALWIANMGPNIDPMTFQTSAPGNLLRLDVDQPAEIREESAAIGSLDGLAELDGRFLVSDTFRGVYSVSQAGDAQLLLNAQTLALSSWADIALGQSGRQLAIPDLFGTRIAFCQLQ